MDLVNRTALIVFVVLVTFATLFIRFSPKEEGL